MVQWSELRRKLLGESEDVAALQKLDLPPVPAVVLEFRRAVDNPGSSHADLAATLDRDPALVLELLRIVNSSAVGLRSRISSSQGAIGLLGARRSKMLVLAAGAKAATRGIKSPFGTPHQFAFAAMQRACFAQCVARHLDADPDLAFAAALLQDFALPSLSNERKDQYRALLEVRRNDSPSLAVLEKKRFGWDHALTGARTLLAWKFPDDLVCLVLAHHWIDAIRANPVFRRSELMAVALSALLPDPLDDRASRSRLLESLIASELGLDLGQLRRQVAEELINSGTGREPELEWMTSTEVEAIPSPGAGPRGRMSRAVVGHSG